MGMDDPKTRIFVELSMNTLSQLNEVEMFRRSVFESADVFHPENTRRYYDRFSELIGRNAWIRGMPHNADSVVTTEDCSSSATRFADEEANIVKRFADQAAIVFAHSVFEAFVQESFETDFQTNPLAWDAEMRRRQVDFETALGTSPEELRTLLWRKIKREITHEASLKENVFRLAAICRVRDREAHDRVRGELKIDLEQIQRIDQLRQKIVHDPQSAEEVVNCAPDIAFLIRTAVMIAQLISDCILKEDLEIGMGYVAVKGAVRPRIDAAPDQ